MPRPSSSMPASDSAVVATFFADDAFEFTEAHAVGVGEFVVGLGVKGVAFLQRLPECGVAHDDGVDDAKFVEGELILAEDAEALGAGDRALGGLELAGEDLHQRGLAGAVGAGNRVAAARHEGGGRRPRTGSGDRSAWRHC